MAVSIEHNYAVGTVWANGAHEKCMVLAHDFVTDRVLIYNYLAKKELFIDRKQLEDKTGLCRKWDEHVAYEQGVFDAMKEPLTVEVLAAFTEDVESIEGPPYAVVREERANGEVWSFVYGEYLLMAPAKSVNRGTLLRINAEFEAVIRHDVRMQRFSKIIWRVFPEMLVHHDEITGERKIKMYARFAAFSGDQHIENNLLAGCRHEGRLT